MLELELVLKKSEKYICLGYTTSAIFLGYNESRNDLTRGYPLKAAKDDEGLLKGVLLMAHRHTARPSLPSLAVLG